MRKKHVGFLKLENVDKAREKLLQRAKLNLRVEIVHLNNALGRVVAEDIYALRDYPPEDRAAVDGVAVRSEDVVGASQSNPIRLEIVGVVEAGDVISGKSLSIDVNQAAIVYTGAQLPQNSDAVIPFEEALIEGNYVYVFKQVEKFKNVSRKGEDFREGELLISKGTLIRPWHIAALVESGYKEVKVFEKPKVCVINVGDELYEFADEASNKSGIPNSTGPLITAYVSELGCEPVYLGIVPDDEVAIKDIVEKALRKCDVVVVTGGTSVGGKDLVPDVLSKFNGAELIFHGVNLRPGRTAGAFLIDGKPVLMLSGLPVAAFVGLENFLKPLIENRLNMRKLPESVIEGKLTRRLANVVGFKSYFRVVVYEDNGQVYITPLRLTGSGILSTLLKGNAVLVIDENVEGYEEGSYVKVKLLNPIYEGRPEFLQNSL
ncbi:MAG: hypothetical protein B7O98_01830 [Zestosphaera tikiterensis]|uniref:MoaB/Mog domain-containing protein n=1 Tax=Zestosphaera tikiterensis TaxID=1973259 RepID=A0A2R7Y7A7_9CREN|nr:MAG: hypothetical protein B7O98_01830 [Zestosphaera tikiterensis]